MARRLFVFRLQILRDSRSVLSVVRLAAYDSHSAAHSATCIVSASHGFPIACGSGDP